MLLSLDVEPLILCYSRLGLGNILPLDNSGPVGPVIAVGSKERTELECLGSDRSSTMVEKKGPAQLKPSGPKCYCEKAFWRRQKQRNKTNTPRVRCVWLEGEVIQSSEL